MIKLFAVGNRFMKDDGVALIVAQKLKSEFNNMDLDILIGETDCQSCFYLLNENDFVIILDALCIGAQPGTIHVFRLEEVLSESFNSYMQHDLDIIELMKLYGGKYRGYIIGIEIASIGFGEELSPILQENMDEICVEIKNKILNIILEESKHA